MRDFSSVIDLQAASKHLSKSRLQGSLRVFFSSCMRYRIFSLEICSAQWYWTTCSKRTCVHIISHPPKQAAIRKQGPCCTFEHPHPPSSASLGLVVESFPLHSSYSFTLWLSDFKHIERAHSIVFPGLNIDLLGFNTIRYHLYWFKPQMRNKRVYQGKYRLPQDYIYYRLFC